MRRMPWGSCIAPVVTLIDALCALLLFSAFASTTSFSQWSTDPLAATRLCTAPDSQEQLCMIADGAGGMIVVWQDFRSGTQYDIYAQRVNALGLTQWKHDGVMICDAPNDQLFPQLVSDGMGGAIIAWDDYRGGDEDDIFVQRISASGEILWTSNGIAVCAAANAQAYPRLVSCETGGAIVAWHDWRTGTETDIYAQRIDASGAPVWANDGIGVCAAPGDQRFPRVVGDGASGAIVLWTGESDADVMLYAQRISASGTAQWGTDGVPVCPAGSGQVHPQLIEDRSGGAIVAWQDSRHGGDYKIYTQALNAFGQPRWSTSGTEVSSEAINQMNLHLTGDGSGGAIIGWMNLLDPEHTSVHVQRISPLGAAQWGPSALSIADGFVGHAAPRIVGDGRAGAIIAWEKQSSLRNATIHVQRVDSAGVAHWGSDGIGVFTGEGAWEEPRLVTDGTGGALLVCNDFSAGASDIYAQNIDAGGHFGYPPTIVSVRDVPNDQGGSVSISWERSSLDASPNGLIAHYEIYRGAAAGSGGIGWERVAIVPGGQRERYSAEVRAPGDSTSAQSAVWYFTVRAYNAPTIFWDSQPDSGRSVDDSAPGGIGTVSTSMRPDGSVSLHWPGNRSDNDIAVYVVYRSRTSGFPLNATTRVAVVADTSFIDMPDHDPRPVYYRVTARDVHGNEGPPSPLAIVFITGIPHTAESTLPREFALEQNYPNPFNHLTTIRYALPVAARVTLEVFTALGTRVARVVDAVQDPGYKSVTFDASGCASGVYFFRLQAGPFTGTKQFIFLK